MLPRLEPDVPGWGGAGSVNIPPSRMWGELERAEGAREKRGAGGGVVYRCVCVYEICKQLNPAA